MEELRVAAYAFGLLALRCLVPLLITVGAGYVLVRLDERWRAAAEAERQAWISAQESGEPGQPLPVGPGILPPLVAPCWVLKGCDSATRQACPAYHNAYEPCWLARLHAEGELPKLCRTCTLFSRDIARDVSLPAEVNQPALFTQQTAQD